MRLLSEDDVVACTLEQRSEDDLQYRYSLALLDGVRLLLSALHYLGEDLREDGEVQLEQLHVHGVTRERQDLYDALEVVFRARVVVEV